ncbi:sugar phosphate nucleotidyltransferase [Microgenomates group bacterium]|nr:sugar phosphate nucleotidyltransferase [Microgenomates group bacterium]
MLRNPNFYAVIMAGGSGTRLWPLSRSSSPKQFQNLISDRSLIQETYDRLAQVLPVEQIYIATIARYKSIVLQHLPKIKEDHLLLEPSSRNSSPAMGYIASLLYQKNPQAIIATAPSDHVVNKTAEYINAYTHAFSYIENNPKQLLTLGIKPDKPNTGLGYMKTGKLLHDSKYQVYQIAQFKEKPDLKTAIEYVKSWQYLWNSGCYFYYASDMIAWLKKARPQVMSGIKEILSLSSKEGEQKKIETIYNDFENEQIEISLIEKMDNAVALPADLGWDDVGAWNALQELLSQKYDAKIISKGNNVDHESESILVYGSEKLIATVGLKDIIVVDSPDALLVMHKSAAQDIKKLLEKLKKEGKNIYL